MIMLGNLGKKRKKGKVIAKGASHLPTRISLKPHSHTAHTRSKTLTISCISTCFLITSENVKAIPKWQPDVRSTLVKQDDALSLAQHREYPGRDWRQTDNFCTIVHWVTAYGHWNLGFLTFYVWHLIGLKMKSLWSLYTFSSRKSSDSANYEIGKR